MKGVLYIDGVDVHTAYGVSVAENAYDDLVCMPDLKPIAYNDWHERNGIEPDLSYPVLAAKSIAIPFHIIGAYGRFEAFIAALSDGAYHTFNFAAIGLTKDLRLVSVGDMQSIQDLSSFSLTFSDDNPMKGYAYVAPASSVRPLGDYLLDGVDFAQYGVRMLEGTIDSIKSKPDVKENLSRDISISIGLEYDGRSVVYKSRTAQLKCFMRAADAEEFWRNRNALLYDLTKTGERILTVTELGKEIPCYYNGCSVECFHPDKGKFWFEFTLSLEFFKGVI